MRRLILVTAALLCNVSGAAGSANPDGSMEGVADRSVELPSGTVFYRDSGGNGVPIVFLHAGSGNSMVWEHQIPTVIGGGYRFIAIDYRGTGNTRPEPGASARRINELLEKLGIDRFHLLGTAAGGGAALEYALDNQDRLRSLIVTNSLGNVGDADYRAIGERLRPPGDFDQLSLAFREIGPSYRALNPEGVERWLALSRRGRDRPTSGGAASGASPGPPPGGPPRGGVTWEKLESLEVPTLLMTGDADLYTPPSVLRLFKQRIDHAEYFIIPESGHSSFWENPEVFNRRVLEFIAKH